MCTQMYHFIPLLTSNFKLGPSNVPSLRGSEQSSASMECWPFTSSSNRAASTANNSWSRWCQVVPLSSWQAPNSKRIPIHFRHNRRVEAVILFCMCSILRILMQQMLTIASYFVVKFSFSFPQPVFPTARRYSCPPHPWSWETSNFAVPYSGWERGARQRGNMSTLKALLFSTLMQELVHRASTVTMIWSPSFSMELLLLLLL